MTPTCAMVSTALTGTLAAGVGTAIFRSGVDDGDPLDQCREGVVAGGAGQIGGSFTLVSETGERVTDRDVIAEPSLICFGDTSRPDVCPLDSVRNAEAVEILSDRGFSVQPVFVTVDPNRDTPEAVAVFTDTIHDRMLGPTGSDAQVRAAAGAFRVFYRWHDDGTDP